MVQSIIFKFVLWWSVACKSQYWMLYKSDQNIFRIKLHFIQYYAENFQVQTIRFPDQSASVPGQCTSRTRKFYKPFIVQTANHQRWSSNGSFKRSKLIKVNLQNLTVQTIKHWNHALKSDLFTPGDPEMSKPNQTCLKQKALKQWNQIRFV